MHETAARTYRATVLSAFKAFMLDPSAPDFGVIDGAAKFVTGPKTSCEMFQCCRTVSENGTESHRKGR